MPLWYPVMVTKDPVMVNNRELLKNAAKPR